MTHNRPSIFRHLLLIIGIAIMTFPIYMALVGASHTGAELLGNVPLWFGDHALDNFKNIFGNGMAGSPPVSTMLFNSLVMALAIAIGKIVISIISAYAMVYFRFPGRMVCFWLIFLTLMLPVEVRILPTYKVVSDLHMLNTYSGLVIPLIASATATFLFRQFFLTIPDELAEAARMDGAGPIRFFFDVVLPLSRTNMAALFVILFIYGWNQYLWPLIITTETDMYTIVMGIRNMVAVIDQQPQWNLVMAAAIFALLPPVLVIIIMQRWFVKGLVDTEK